MTDLTLTLPGDDIEGLFQRCSPLIHEDGRVGVFSPPYWPRPADMSGWSLHLIEATGRSHAALWVARKMGRDAYDARFALDPATEEWGIHYTGPNVRGYFTIPMPEALDRDGDRTLEDGSPWRTADTLRRLVMRLAGLGWDHETVEGK